MFNYRKNRTSTKTPVCRVCVLIMTVTDSSGSLSDTWQPQIHQIFMTNVPLHRGWNTHTHHTHIKSVLMIKGGIVSEVEYITHLSVCLSAGADPGVLLPARDVH